MDAPHPKSSHAGHQRDLSDEELTREVRKPSGNQPAHWSFEELLARHWQPVVEYAELCTVSDQAAGILSSAAFTRLFVGALRWSGPMAVWRPELLVTVDRIAAEWADDPRRQASLHPALRGRDEPSVARPSMPENRRLVYQAFQRLPEPARCLLWHAEVEAEGLEVPATLLGLTPMTAAAQLESSRVRFRAACVAAHRDLAAYEACLRFSRLLDVSVQRGGTHLVPDLQRHVADCSHCRYAAEQLDHSGDRVGVLIAEAVLDRAARAYLDSRPARRRAREAPAVSGPYGSSSPRYGARPRPSHGSWPDTVDSAPPLSAIGMISSPTLFSSVPRRGSCAGR
ncbi:hypothetical protein [Streptomyces sp. NBC_00079]|uniref:hypothetical protein n=1 Tax=Streptomyces sp. NBC_00079 TaxID=2975644 RepID=UPI0032528F3D